MRASVTDTVATQADDVQLGGGGGWGVGGSELAGSERSQAFSLTHLLPATIHVPPALRQVPNSKCKREDPSLQDPKAE